jgi:hypothetical protein
MMSIFVAVLCVVFAVSFLCFAALCAGAAWSSRNLPLDLAEEPIPWDTAPASSSAIETIAPHQA